MLISFVVRSICSQSPFVLRGSNHAKLLYKVAAFDKRIGSKFLLESDPSSSNIEEFSKGLYDGTISPYFRSQSIPNNDGASIEVVVGRTFDELDLKTTTKNVEKLAKHFKDFDNIVFAISKCSCVFPLQLK
ncbi:protein disulfide isomerase-like 1-6 [Cucumis melo var. makuwa]|uniref:Protein disulfide isomerase-like 1-6 n=2 Tax=Cucumis melo TaxID=3656 RepID=A0A5D3CXC7_CUCMM|nr:protein disulfide isomerase-like 1-6 [Cucumis melo]KAA0063897.1 protein disulfide isomerase-like 1-6 [Cucumis melo var. makuwa]TYK15908.1 protein disulfide isomerase-like 1-6 [Cucumis melo var. makuwa]